MNRAEDGVEEKDSMTERTVRSLGNRESDFSSPEKNHRKGRGTALPEFWERPSSYEVTKHEGNRGLTRERRKTPKEHKKKTPTKTQKNTTHQRDFKTKGLAGKNWKVCPR